MAKYSYSSDEERFHGECDTIDEALKEAIDELCLDDGNCFWVGENRQPSRPEDLWSAEDWLEHVSVQDDYSGEWAEDWDRSTKDQRAELEKEVRAVMAAWLEKHGLRPRHWSIDDSVKYQVVNGVAEKVN